MRLRALQRIYQLSEATSRAEDVQDIYDLALAALQEVLGGDRAAVLLLDQGRRMCFVAHRGLSAPYRLAAEGHSPWPADARDPQPVLVPDVTQEPELASLRRRFLAEGIAALGFIPLCNHGRLLGKLMIYYDQPHSFDDEQVQLAQTVASHIAFAIDRAQREAALRLAREELRIAVSNAPIVLFAMDERGVITLCEGRGMEALGLRPADLIGRTGREVFPDVDRIGEGFARGIEGQDGTLELNVRGHCFSVYYGPMREGDRAGGGRIIGVTGVATDITARRRAEEDLALLAAASAQLAGSLDYPTTLAAVTRLFVPRLADHCAIVEAWGEGPPHVSAVHHADPARAKLAEALRARLHLGLPPAHPALRVIAEGTARCEEEVTDAGLRAGCFDEEHCRLEEALGARARLVLPLRVRGATRGAVVLCLGAGARRYEERDVRLGEELALRAAMALENARLFAQAREAVQAREEMLSVASHEVRAPLNTLNLQMQLLLRSAQKGQITEIAPERLLSMLESGERQVRRLTELIQQLLDITRLTAGEPALREGEMDLTLLVQEVVARAAVELERAGCAIHVRADGPCVGRWDRSQLDQVITNLLGNAMKYGAERPIEVTVEREGQVARLLVMDQGIGIAPEHQRQIFERFQRVADRRYGGLGLGLYIVRKILAAMGGTIQVRSQPGAGATFVVELPVGGLE
jgi:PAS domain S-box-containing protein